MVVPRIAWQAQHARGTLSVLISCVVHTCVLIFLALTYIVTQQPQTAEIVLHAAIAGADDVSLELDALSDVEQPSAAELPSTVYTPSSDQFELNISSDLATTTQRLDASLTASVASLSRSGAAGGVAGGRGGGGVAEELDQLGANFFGSYATGQHFVFVLDSSRSMTGDRWLYACQELLDSIARLQPNQKFFVILFDDKTTPMFNTPKARIEYQSYTPELRQRLKSWLARRRLGPGTMPANALMMALELHPDAIFMLSDGELQDQTLNVLRMMNGFSTERRQTPIHTVHLMSDDGRLTLQTIASENSGTFTPIRGGGIQ